MIEEALRRLGYEKHREQVVMVGDRRYDVEGAGKCGLQCVGAAFGYGGREELEKAGAVFIAGFEDATASIFPVSFSIRKISGMPLYISFS